MATRRIVGGEKTILEKDDTQNEKSDISPAVPKNVIFKLLGFTAAMIIIPIGSYFLTVNSLFNGNSSYAGGTAALLANVVLVGYIVVAMREDEEDLMKSIKTNKKQESKKDS